MKGFILHNLGHQKNLSKGMSQSGQPGAAQQDGGEFKGSLGYTVR